MVKAALLLLALPAAMGAQSAQASELAGPGRFCGYSPIVDLLPGERIVTLEGGIHAGTFRWDGPFGSLEVAGVGWASRPRGNLAARRTARGHAIFKERMREGRYSVAIWNGRNGAAYFTSPSPLTRAQRAAIERVDLFQEGEEPEGCRLRTMFSWE